MLWCEPIKREFVLRSHDLYIPNVTSCNVSLKLISHLNFRITNWLIAKLSSYITFAYQNQSEKQSKNLKPDNIMNTINFARKLSLMLQSTTHLLSSSYRNHVWNQKAKNFNVTGIDDIHSFRIIRYNINFMSNCGVECFGNSLFRI